MQTWSSIQQKFATSSRLRPPLRSIPSEHTTGHPTISITMAESLSSKDPSTTSPRNLKSHRNPIRKNLLSQVQVSDPRDRRLENSYQPVLDRAIFLLSAALKPISGDTTQADVRLVITPLVTLWNPYNVALEIDGAIVYPWIDMPFRMDWKFRPPTGASRTPGSSMANTMGYQFHAVGHGRSVDPYFFASMVDSSGPIRFEPGEVRVFAPSSTSSVEYLPAGTVAQRTIQLTPVTNVNQLSTKGGIAVPMNNTARGQMSWDKMKSTDKASVVFKSAGGQYPFFVSLEDGTRARNSNQRGTLYGDVQTVNFSNSGGATTINSPEFSYSELLTEPKVFGMLETYHRVANDAVATRRADLVSTINPRQANVNRYLTEGDFQAAPHYETLLTARSTVNGLIQTTTDGRNAFYGATNSSATGRKQLAFFEVPQAPLLSLAGFSNADLTGTSYSPAYQFGNSVANPYLERTLAGKLLPGGSGGGGSASFTREPMPIYDVSYLTNEALWDSYYFSGAAPTLQPGSGGGSAAAWDSEIANVTRNLSTVIDQFVDNSGSQSLKNPRMTLHLGDATQTELKADLKNPEGCKIISSHVLLDGAFNVNSTSIDAWKAFLAGMRGQPFTVSNGSAPPSSETSFPRFRDPVGTADATGTASDPFPTAKSTNSPPTSSPRLDHADLSFLLENS